MLLKNKDMKEKILVFLIIAAIFGGVLTLRHYQCEGRKSIRIKDKFITNDRNGYPTYNIIYTDKNGTHDKTVDAAFYSDIEKGDEFEVWNCF